MRCRLLQFLCIVFSLTCIAQDASNYSDKGYNLLYTHKDSSYYYFQKAIDTYKEALDIDNQLGAYFGLLYANGYYYDLKAYKDNLTAYEQLLNSDIGSNSLYHTYFKDRLYLERINYHFKLSQEVLTQKYIDSLKWFQQERPVKDRDSDYYDCMLNSGLYQGSLYKKQHKINLALDKYLQLEGFVTRHQDSLYDYKSSLFSIKRLKAKTYAALGNPDSAILTQIEALNVIGEDPAYTNSALDITLDLLNNLIATSEYKEAQQLIKLLDKKQIEKSNFKIRLLDEKIKLLRIQENPIRNRALHREKLKEIQAYRTVVSHPDIINAYIQYADDELYWGAIDAAFAKLKSASDLLSKASYTNENFAVSKLQLALAAQYIKTYKATSSELNAKDILATTEEILGALEILHPQFESKLDKQYLINSAFPALQDAFELMYELYTATSERVYLDQAFSISEKSKAIELRSIRQAGIAQQTLDVDPAIIETENLYNYTINQLEKDLFTKTENKQELQDSLLQQKEAFGDFVAALRDLNPSYHKIRYRNHVATLPQSIDYLPENSAALSFFQVNSTMYAVRITKNDADIIAIPFTEAVQQELRDYYQAISNSSVGNTEHLERLSRSLYKTFIHSCFPEELPQSLTIVPDGLLHYIPFEALTSEAGFLIKNTTISYKPSISFMQGSYVDQALDATLFGFAPRFDGTSKPSLATLSYNEEEIEQANAYFKGTVYKGEKGSLARFRESIKNNLSSTTTPIYHLATHAITNDTLPEYSYLAFTPKTKDEDFILYAKDLYTAQLNGAMVVLSACETGVGRLETGQGMQSLAQGFSYGGASSLIYSKWNVGDRYTATIMGLFYKHLDAGLPKDKALQRAKVEYLTTIDDPNVSHPFYWASFVFSGDATPLESSNDITFWLWIIGGLIVVAIFGLLARKRLSQ